MVAKPPLVAALAAACASAALAQTTLPHLHVISLTLRSDTSAPRLEVPFHLTIAAHFSEVLPSVDFVVLPPLSELEDLGDERRTVAGPRGTDFTETLTVVAHHTGMIHIAPAYLDAIDGRTHKPNRYSSNDLTLHVMGGVLLDPFAQLRSFLSLFMKIVALAVAALVIGLIFVRRKRVSPPPTAPVAAAVATPVAQRTLHDEVREGLAELRVRRDRATVLRVRNRLWRMVGAREGETLGDVLGRRAAGAPEIGPLLRTVERAVFIQDAYREGAVDDMILALERYLA